MHFLKGAGGGGFLRSFYQTSFFLVLMKVSLIFIVVLNLGSSSFIRMFQFLGLSSSYVIPLSIVYSFEFALILEVTFFLEVIFHFEVVLIFGFIKFGAIFSFWGPFHF